MQKFSITDAAKLVKKARGTLYKHIDQGKLSVKHDNDNKPFVELVELIRVYGPIEGVDTKDVQFERSETDKKDDILNGAKREIELLNQIITEKDARLLEKDAHIQDLKNAMAMIADKTEKKGFLAKLFS